MVSLLMLNTGRGRSSRGGGGLGQDNGKLIAAVSRGCIDSATVDAEYVGDAAECPAAGQVTIRIVDFFQLIQIEQQNGKWSSRAPGAFDLRIKGVNQAAVISQTCERVGNGQKLQLLFRLLVLGDVEGRDHIARHTIKFNGCRCDFEPPHFATVRENLDLVVRSVPRASARAVPDQLARIGMGKVREAHGQKLLPCVAGDALRGMIYIVQPLAPANEYRCRNSLR